jgi:glycyl-tRNA synthetase
MAFVVKKTISGNDYYYLNENKRVEGKVKTKTIAYLGKDKKDAEKKAKEIIEKMSKEGEKKVVVKAVGKLEKKDISIEDMSVFCKKKGFVYQSGEIYGGMAGFWDFGHLGVELNNNLKQSWWNFHVRQREDVVGIDGSIITNPKVWKASGHVDSFSDIFVVCKKCKKPGKVDKNELGKVKCPACGGDFDESTAKEFKLMFETDIGLEGHGYLRPETAQLIFTNFKLVQENARMKLPFGIAQIGKAFRNEIAPRDFLFRCREFEQMEMEYFVDPKEECPYKVGNSKVLIYSAEMQDKNKEPEKMKIKDAFDKKIIKTKWHAYWLEQEYLWFIGLGANSDKFRLRQHVSDEKSHYALDTWDLEYNFPFGWRELQGMANRTDFDLKQHQEHSKVNLKIMNNKEEKILPHVVCEPSLGVGRALMVFLFDSYYYDKKRDNVVLKLHPQLAPVKAAVFPIVKRKEYEKIASDVVNDLKKEWNVLYDRSGSIGRRYSRNDEVGTPYCITVDENSLDKNEITIRDRDTTKQIKIKISEVRDVVRKLINQEIEFEKAGKLIGTRIK